MTGYSFCTESLREKKTVPSLDWENRECRVVHQISV